MPLTPYHLGPALFLGVIASAYLDLTTLLIASIILDIEPFIVLFLDLDAPLHGFSHTLLGGVIIAAALSLVITQTAAKKRKRAVWLAAYTGVFTHILLDAPLYSDIRPFYPLQENPLYNSSMFAGFEVVTICAVAFFAGLLIGAYQRIRKH